MNIHNQEENDLSKLHHQLDILFHIHSLNDSSKSGNSDQFQQTKKRQDFILLQGNGIHDCVEWNCSKEIDSKPSSEIVLPDRLLVKDFITTQRIIVGRLELDEDIDQEDEVND